MTLTTQTEFGVQLAEFDKIHETCRKLLATKHYQGFGEGGIHAIMARAKTLGIHPFEALNNGFFCINGKVGMYTEMMMALVRQRGHSITKDPKSNNESVILHGKRIDSGDTWTCSFTRQDAEAAGLWNTSVWKKYPSIMLYNRCASMLFRQLFPDLSLGAGYDRNELEEITKTGDFQERLPVAECETKTIEKPKELISVPRVTPEQVKLLEEILPYTDQKFQARIPATLKAYKWASLAEMTPEVFDIIYPQACINRDELLGKPEELEEVQDA